MPENPHKYLVRKYLRTISHEKFEIPSLPLISKEAEKSFFRNLIRTENSQLACPQSMYHLQSTLPLMEEEMIAPGAGGL
jgi:hypothetical protein